MPVEGAFCIVHAGHQRLGSQIRKLCTRCFGGSDVHQLVNPCPDLSSARRLSCLHTVPFFVMDALQPSLVAAATHVQQMDYTQRVYFTVAAAALGGAYLRLVVSRLPPARGLLAVAPLIVLNCWLPLIFHMRDELITRACWMLLLLWLANFKAIGLCLGRGPLIGSWTISQTVLLYMLPIYPSQGPGQNKRGRLQDSAGTGSQMLMSFIANTTFLVVIAYLLTLSFPQFLKHYLYGLGLYGFITFIMDGPAAFLIGALDMQVAPPFDRPWLATSLADFWGRRWNNTVGLTLRALVYDPLVEGALVFKPALPAAAVTADQRQAPAGADAAAAAASPATKHPHSRTPMWLRFAGLCATFAVSGLMHELILYNLCYPGEYRFGYWFMFFFVQAPLMAAEAVVIRRIRKAGVKVPRAGAIGITTFVFMCTTYWFWFPPVEKHTDIALSLVANINRAAAQFLTTLQQIPQQLDKVVAASITPATMSV